MRLLDAALQGAKAVVPDGLKRKIRVACGVPDMEASLLNMQRNGFHPQRVIDVGAYVGDWTRMCRRLFPDARVLMIEPQGRLRETLQQMAAADPRVEFSPVLVGANRQAAVPFYESESASS